MDDTTLLFIDNKKIFQCNGFGSCRMTFTRSEHLARHERKHTGERPFKCIVPGCSRKFSRFDNMMQHTQTHHHTAVITEKVPDLVKSKKRKAISKKTKSVTKSNQKIPVVIKSLTSLPTEKDCDEIMDDLFSLSDSSLSSDEEIDIDDSIKNDHPRIDTAFNEQTTMKAEHMILPHLASYLVNYPEEPPENFFFQHYHRLSVQDLKSPIHRLGQLQYTQFVDSPNSVILPSCLHQVKPFRKDNSVDEVYITIDELEALEGLSLFALEACQK